MIGDIMSSAVILIKKAHRQYSAGGIKSLISEGAKFVNREWLKILIRQKYISRSELERLTEQKDHIWYGKKEESFEVSPSTHPMLREEFGPYPKEYSPQKPFVCEIRNCYLLDQCALGITEDGGIISETTPLGPKRLSRGGNNHFVSTKDYSRLLSIGKQTVERRIDDRVFPMIESNGYYHWVVEHLPKIRLLEYYTEKTGYEPTILVNSDSSKFVKESLKTIGYGPDEYEEWSGGTAQVNSLIIPTHRVHRFNYYDPKKSKFQLSRDDLIWLRNRLRGKPDKKEEGKKIYVSRQKTKERKVDNYNEVTSIIDDFGFESYVLEDLPFQRQIELFEEAEVIMGPHGAGLTNMIFSDNPLVIEMLPEDTLRPHFYFISGAMGFDYEPIVTEVRDGNLIVDINSLRDHIESLGI